MATNTYVALKQTTVSGSPVTSVTFDLTTLTASYTDLIIVLNCKGTVGGYPYLRFNSDSGSNYSNTWLRGNGTTANSGRDTSVTEIYLSNALQGYGTSNFEFNSIAQINNYSNSTTYKTVLSRQNKASYGTEAAVGLWRNTAAITSIYIGSSSNFDVGSTFSLYGIASTANTAKATGGIITSDANYIYHTFTSSGTFTPTQSFNADVLVVAGGGGAGKNYGGGGGAGGLCWQSSRSLSATGYTVTIGSGGAGATSAGNGATGNNSVFDTITANGGGYGGGNGTSNTGGNGGSGGGGSTAGSATQGNSGGATGYGNNGGSKTGSSSSDSGGGGGAGAVGGNGVNSSGQGKGGNGLSGATLSALNEIGAACGVGQLSSGNYYVAGGGGGNSGGTNGLGGGSSYNGGGGLGDAGASGGNGGSGIVIVRYAK